MSEWWLVPAKRRNKRKSVMKDNRDSKAGRLEDAAASKTLAIMITCLTVKHVVRQSGE